MYRPGQPLRIAIIGGGLDSVDFLDGAEQPELQTATNGRARALLHQSNRRDWLKRHGSQILGFLLRSR
jgi:hypothetical protein